MAIIKKFFKFLRNVMIFIIVQAFVFITYDAAMVFYGPFENTKEMLVTTAMTTLKHQYLVKMFLSEKEIDRIMEKNKIVSAGKYSDTSAIAVSNFTNTDSDQNDSDNQNKSSNNYAAKASDPGTINLVDISNGKYKGYLLLISNPARVKIGTTDKLGTYGMKLEDIVKKYDATAAINAGGFVDTDGMGNGGTATGVVMENGNILCGKEGEKYLTIGFDENSAFVLGEFTIEEMKERKIRDAVSFDPFIIVNGEPQIESGNVGWGLAPRTAIGQKKDGTVVFLVIDGRQLGSVGATLAEVQDILLKNDVYNAANLDGGSSTQLIYENKTINHPCSSAGPRYIPTAFIVK
ncbi:MAG: phosphodiester glycosidase family protein [Bacillota bacterium]|nr:phosphodiester glycosidase family protein [Bacillota bacterium]